jgi:ribonuclease R
MEKMRAILMMLYIADVSHYVEPGSEMDEEAYSRGTSVYFPRKVIPMLPEKVSNYLCSLVPNEDRLVLACDMNISEEGEINSFEFYEAVINSRKRLTYILVQDLIDSSSIDNDYESILHLLELTKILLYQRSLRGALEFESEEPKFEFDQNGRICFIGLNKRNFAHQMIEESMLCANLCAAKFFVKNEIPSLYRVHPEPEEEKKSALRQSLLSLGLDLGHGSLDDYQQILQALKKFEAGQVIQLQVLRSMQQAVYKPENEGHFGLGYKEYTHFTSPIRRYPDLLVHRIIKSYLLLEGPDFPSSREKKMNMGKNPYLHDHNNLVEYGEHLSYTERRADGAVFSFLDWAKCDFMSGRIGAEFSGLISAVTKFGFFVKLESLPIEGLVHIKSLKEDYFDFHDKDISLRGRNSDISFAVGDVVSVRLTAVNTDEKKIDLDLINHRPMARKKSKKDKKTKNRKRNSRGR